MDSERRVGLTEVRAVIVTIDCQRAAELPRPVRERVVSRSRTAPGPHHIDTSHNLRSANQNRFRFSRADRDDIEAVVKAVNQVDIGVTRLTPHGFRALRSAAAKGMTGRVVDTEVCLDLGQANDHFAVGVAPDDQLAQEISRHLLGGALIEFARK